MQWVKLGVGGAEKVAPELGSDKRKFSLRLSTTISSDEHCDLAESTQLRGGDGYPCSACILVTPQLGQYTLWLLHKSPAAHSLLVFVIPLSKI